HPDRRADYDEELIEDFRQHMNAARDAPHNLLQHYLRNPLIRSVRPDTLSYQMLLLAEMRDRAPDFDDDRFIQIPSRRRRQLAEDVDLADPARRAIEASWSTPGPEQFIELAKGDRVRLGRRYESTDMFLVDAAQRTIRAQQRRRRGPC
ncbi:MAG: hypothetical protein K8H88_11625, partial [Sandaracinaceae bacterium]|nr:hypothetical protein [Sandaracinaceae bacterium]